MFEVYYSVIVSRIVAPNTLFWQAKTGTKKGIMSETLINKGNPDFFWKNLSISLRDCYRETAYTFDLLALYLANYNQHKNVLTQYRYGE
jgi:hypothetical protein